MQDSANVAELVSTTHILLCFATCQYLMLKSDMPWQKTVWLINMISQGCFQYEKERIFSSERQRRLLQIHKKVTILQKYPLALQSANSDGLCLEARDYDQLYMWRGCTRFLLHPKVPEPHLHILNCPCWEKLMWFLSNSTLQNWWHTEAAYLGEILKFPLAEKNLCMQNLRETEGI